MDKQIELPEPEEIHGPYPCDECQAGMMRLRFVTYMTRIGQEPILVPSFPAWICDVCGRREWDEKALAWVTALLDPEAGKPSQRGTSRAQHAHSPLRGSHARN